MAWLALSLLFSYHVSSHAASSQPPAEVSGALPHSIGIVGVGTIGSAVVRGLLSGADHLPYVPNFVLSPRDAKKAAALKKEFPNYVRVAETDQEVVDAADCVVIALPGSVAAKVTQALQFQNKQQVISLVAAVNFTQLQDLLGPQVDFTMACPLPAVAIRKGTTVGFPSKPYAEAIFSAMGSYIAVADEEQYKIMKVGGALMGDFYMRQLTFQQWMASHGVQPDKAASYIGSVFATIAADSADANSTTFAEKVAEQTPNGTNEMVWKQQAAAGVYAAFNKSLDSVISRSTKASLDNVIAV